MSIGNKLNYLSETKNLIKQALINKGVEVDSSLPFREYASKIDEIQIESITMYDVIIPANITSEITIEEV